MKRRKSKWIGLILIISAFLLQVGYAAGVTIKGTASTADYAVQINCTAENPTDPINKYVTVNIDATNSKNGVVVVEAGNLFPGAEFVIKSDVTNVGQKNVRFKSVDIKCLDGNPELFKNLVFFDKDNKEISVENYKNYLASLYPNNVFEPGKTVSFDLKIGLSKDVTELENEKTRFELTLVYDQDDPGSTSGGGTGSSTGGGTTTINPTPTQLTEEPTPGGPAKIETVPEEPTPGGPKPNRAAKTEIPDEEVPKGPALPKTGGVDALFVYALGLVMLGGGIVIYRRGRKQENQ